MTNFNWRQDKANRAGKVLCMICFEMKPVDKMYTDEHGCVWDVCLACRTAEDLQLERIFNGYTS